MNRDAFKPIHGIIPKIPNGGLWRCFGFITGANAYAFRSPYGLTVLSSVVLYEGKREFHISITDNGGRIPASLVPTVLEQFDCVGFDEDNHVPDGKARNFFGAIDEEQKECGCKENEPPTIDGDYIWRPDNAGR